MQSLDQTEGIFTNFLFVKDSFAYGYCPIPPSSGEVPVGKGKARGMERSSRKGPMGPRPWVAVSLQDFLRLHDWLDCAALEKGGHLA